MHLLLCVVALCAQLQPADAPTQNEPPAPTPAPVMATKSSSAFWGVGLVAAGASVAAASTAGFTLVEALSTPDRASNPISEDAENFTQAAGFTTVALVSLSAVLLVVGTGLILVDEDTPPSAR